jgi:hypothetical protein
VTATAVRFHVTHRALTEMRLVTTVALKRGRNHTPSHAACLLEPHSWAGVMGGPLLCWNFTNVGAFLQHVMFSSAGGVAVLFTPCARKFPNAYAAKACPAQLRPTPSRCEKTTRSTQIYSHRTVDRSDIPRLICRLTVGNGADGQRRSVHRAAYSVARRAGKGPARSFSQRRPLQQSGNEVAGPVIRADVVHGKNVGMLQRATARASCSERRRRSASQAKDSGRSFRAA